MKKNAGLIHPSSLIIHPCLHRMVGSPRIQVGVQVGPESVSCRPNRSLYLATVHQAHSQSSPIRDFRPMMQAVDVVTGWTVAGEEARRERRYLCPECGALVGLRLGARKAPHFAHYVTSRCTLAEPEGPRHRALKRLCKRFFAPLPVVWEAAVGERRVDALVGARFVVECQCSPLSPRDWRARSENHHRHGFPVLWLWDVKRLCRKNMLAEAMMLERNGRSVWVPPEIRLCHDESGGFVMVADKHEMLPCRLMPLSEGEQSAAKRDGSPAAVFWPDSLRRLTLVPDFDRNARSHLASRSGKFRVVRLGKPVVAQAAALVHGIARASADAWATNIVD